MAPTVKHTITEVDVVAFTKAVDKDETLTQPASSHMGVGKWPAGTEGTVVSDYGDHKEVEIVGEHGETLDLVTVPVEHLKLVEKHS